MSITLNCLVSNSCASDGLTVIDWKSILPSSTATPFGVPVIGLNVFCQTSLISCFCFGVNEDCNLMIPAKFAPPLKNPSACASLSVASLKVFLACCSVLIPVMPS